MVAGHPGPQVSRSFELKTFVAPHILSGAAFVLGPVWVNESVLLLTVSHFSFYLLSMFSARISPDTCLNSVGSAMIPFPCVEESKIENSK